jgi:MFS family permease
MTYGRDILILSIVFLVGSLALNLIGPIWPIYIKDYLHASMTELGFVFSISNGVAAVVQIFSGFLSDRYGRRTIHALGTLLAAFPPLMYALCQWLVGFGALGCTGWFCNGPVHTDSLGNSSGCFLKWKDGFRVQLDKHFLVDRLDGVSILRRSRR